MCLLKSEKECHVRAKKPAKKKIKNPYHFKQLLHVPSVVFGFPRSRPVGVEQRGDLCNLKIGCTTAERKIKPIVSHYLIRSDRKC